MLRLSGVGSKFTKFLMSFFKAQFRSSSNFASFFNVMPHNSSVLFWLKHNILSTKLAHKCANFQTCPLRALKFTKLFMSVLEPRVRGFFSNFASSFSVMTHNSSEIFHLKICMLWTKEAHKSADFQTFYRLHEN